MRKERSSIGQKKTQAAVIDSGVAMSGIFNYDIHAGIQTMLSDHVQYVLYLVFSLRSYTHAPQGL